jgi:hypothetical protein
LGGVAGPLLVISASAVATAQGVFAISAVLVMLVAGLALLDLRVSCAGEECWAEAKEYAMRRAAVAQATLHGIVTSASIARQR